MLLCYFLGRESGGQNCHRLFILSIKSAVCSLMFSLCTQVLVAAVPLQATALYASLSKVCLLWHSNLCWNSSVLHHLLSPFTEERKFPVFLKFPSLWEEIPGLMHLDNNGSTASSSGFLVFPNFWQISSRALQVDF